MSVQPFAIQLILGGCPSCAAASRERRWARRMQVQVQRPLVVTLVLGLLLCVNLSVAAGTRVVEHPRASDVQDKSVSRAVSASRPVAASREVAVSRAVAVLVSTGAPATSAVTRMLDPGVRSAAALIVDQRTGTSLYAKNDTQVLPIASITKLMTALVVLDAELPMDEQIEIGESDVDRVKQSASRLRVGTLLTRETLLQLALMASENRAASALSRVYPGGKPRFIAAMNRKAIALGMQHTHFNDATGLNSGNVSTARDLVQLVRAAGLNPYIRAYTTSASLDVTSGTRQLRFNNTNPLLREQRPVNASMWQIGLSKTGFIEEAGHCLVMRALVAGQDVVIVLLNSQGKYTRIGDSNRVRQWLERLHGRADNVATAAPTAARTSRQPPEPIRARSVAVGARAVAAPGDVRAARRTADRAASGRVARPSASISWSEPRRSSLDIESADGS